eukprot:776215-Amphidinium_carterae.1
MARASTGSGVEVDAAPRMDENAPDLAGRDGDPASARGRQPPPPPARNSVLSMLRAGPAQRRSRSRVPKLDSIREISVRKYVDDLVLYATGS